VALVVAAVVATGAVVGVRALLDRVSPPPPSCSLGTGAAALVLSTEQAQNATTIAAVAHRMAMPDHAVTVALATALQESKLVNLPFGDRDSVGLFQQRPSQGWGRPAQLLNPSYAAAAFYRHLRSVPGWTTLPVTAAAQDVQHSADGTGYAQWEEEARALARVLTGEQEPGLTCRFATSARPRPAAVQAQAARELGPGALTAASPSVKDGWIVAEWLVGHAYADGIEQVAVGGRVWTSASGRWATATGTGPPSYRFGAARS
jgi:hypothetical protein